MTESIAASDLENGELRKIRKIEKTVNWHRGKPAALLQERGASAKRTQADSRRSLMSSLSQEPRASGTLAAMFSPGTKDQETNSRVLLDDNKDHLHSQGRSAIMKQEHQVESLNYCFSELQQQTYAHRLQLQDAQRGYFESRREQLLVCKKNYRGRKRSLEILESEMFLSWEI